LLLSWGANPDTLDDEGNTPLLWMVKNYNRDVAHGPFSNSKYEIIRFLVKFGSNLLIQDKHSGDSVLHILARSDKTNLSLMFFLFQSGKSQLPFLTNSAGLTPYKVKNFFFLSYFSFINLLYLASYSFRKSQCSGVFL
jgi:ankyrin repeat protein